MRTATPRTARSAAAALAAVALLATGTACGSSKSSGAATSKNAHASGTLNVWIRGAGDSPKAYQKLFDAFTAQSGIKVAIGKATLTDFETALTAAASAHQLPDMVVDDAAQLGDFISMKRMPLELEEAARIDGAGDFRIFWRIVLPVCRPALGTCAVFGFLMIWDQYLLPLLVSQTPKMDTLTVVVTSLQASQEQGEGVRLAAVLILAVPGVLVYLALQRLFERGLLSGSLKG